MPVAASMPCSPESLTVRSLSNLSELISWSNFCASRGFGHRGPGDSQRFANKFQSDTSARLDWVLICTSPRTSCGIPLDIPAQQLHPLSPPSLPVTLLSNTTSESENLDNSDVILGSCRLFSRRIFIGKEEGFVNAIGWGEVCSEPEMRGRGVAGAVLTKALELTIATSSSLLSSIEADASHSIALLHAAAGVQGLYQKFGFTAPLRAQYRVLPYSYLIQKQQKFIASTHIVIRKADFEKDVSEFQRLHINTVESLNLVGWTDRNEAYWKDWIRFTSRDHTWVLEDMEVASEPRLLAYACAQWQRDGVLKVCDFGFSRTCTSTNASYLLSIAMKRGWAVTSSRPPSANSTSQQSHQGIHAGEESLPDLITPLPILQWLYDNKNDESASSIGVSVSELDDISWMVRSLCHEGQGVIEKLSGSGSRFIAFAVDGF
jgi:predicted GNAT family N-acyltransferase